jgi:arabinofuranan 3-O-arabinosyltransferase
MLPYNSLVGTGNKLAYVIAPRLWSWAASRRALNALVWIVALLTAVQHVRQGREWLANRPDTPAQLRRPDPGGYGHTQIDFGGQWVMGRMLVLGHGRELYHRQRQWEVVRQGFPVSDETPLQREASQLPGHTRPRSDDDSVHDADRMMYWFMGSDPPVWKTVGGAAAAPLAVDPAGNPLASIALVRASERAVTPAVVAEIEKPAVGGPLYPPIHAFLYAPLGLFEHPRDALHLFQFLSIGFALFAARGLALLTQGRVWWSAAFAAVLLYPGCRSSIDLGQNPTLSLCIVVWGWVLAARNREWSAGAVWGLFAFKPIWGLAFFLVPLVMGRWRICAAMIGTGAGLAALTLPFVGLQTWFDWLKVGTEAAELYNRSQNWINFSRDLQGIPRRFLHDFTLPVEERETTLAKVVAWSLWSLVFATTVVVYRLRADRGKRLGLGTAFLFLGAWLTCYRFMYYDALLSIVGAACLFAEPWRLFRTRVFGLDFAPQSVETGTSISPAAFPGRPFGAKLLGYFNSFPLTVILGFFLLDNLIAGLNVEATFGIAAWGHTVTAPGGSTALSSPRVHADSSLAYPWDTALVIALWAWCAVRLLLGDERQRGMGEAPP